MGATRTCSGYDQPFLEMYSDIYSSGFFSVWCIFVAAAVFIFFRAHRRPVQTIPRAH